MLTKVGASSNVSVELPPLNLKRLEIFLVGDTPIIIHRWSEKAKKELLDRQLQKAKGKKGARDPQKDFEDSLYKVDENGTLDDEHGTCFGFPVIGFKAAAVTACTSIGGITKVQARQAFHIEGEYAVIKGSEPKMREDMVRIGMGTADIRFRPEFFPWYTRLVVSHNANVISAEQILNMLNTAGFGVGVGEWRPEKDGPYGRFHVASTAEVEEIAKTEAKTESAAAQPKKVSLKK